STSKIRSAKDLEAIGSLGFRGEALSSIAAEAGVDLITRTADSIFGLRYVIEDSIEKESEQIGAPAGTTFLVRDLFEHVPARKKFLASDQTEAAAIADMAEKIALSHPEVSIRLILNGKLRFMTTGSGKLQEVIYALLGRGISGELLPVSAEEEGIRVGGFAGKPTIARGNRGFELFFINGRTVKSKLLTEALEEAYYGHLMMHKYPVAVLYLDIDPGTIDVNVHPSKLEVRFEDERRVRNTVIAAVKAALAQNELIQYVDQEEESAPAYQKAWKTEGYHEPFETALMEKEAAEKDRVSTETVSAEQWKKPGTAGPASENNDVVFKYERPAGSLKENSDYSAKNSDHNAEDSGPQELLHREEEAEDSRKEEAENAKPEEHSADPIPLATQTEQQELPADRILSPANRADFRLLGIAFDTYLLVQLQDDFLMIDQHAAHEKVLYERFMAEFESQGVTSQLCAPPIVFTVSSPEETVLIEHREQFEALGFEIEPFGGKDYALYAVPANMLSLARADVFLELLDEMAAEGTSSSRLVHDRIAKMACKAAVKGLDPLTPMEAEALITELLELKDPYTCPHGRPTTILMSRAEIEKRFKRIVP
ncbi:MAG: DNA mismatch repair protein MutL, partial [Lachnospiraceae bacterium]|nr:DNA mismatch repair protein MutL [Lachnospiraceae bacterium]